jgi:hypothetical protein
LRSVFEVFLEVIMRGFNRFGSALCLLATTMFGGATAAQTTDACTPGSVVYFVNGIDNNEQAATLSLATLKAVIGRTQTSDGKPITFFNTWNPNDGLQGDLEESILQWARQYGVGLDSVVRIIVGQLAAAIRNGRIDLYIRVAQSLYPTVFTDQRIADFRTFVANEPARLLAAQRRADAVLQTVTSQLQTFLNQGNRVLLVTHSQGNFIGNAAYNNVPSNLRTGLKRIGIAAPVNAIAGGGPYFSFQLDVVVQGVPGSLSPNVPASGLQTTSCPGDLWRNHAFVACYMNASSFSFGAEARQRIKDAVDQGLTIPQPTPLTRLGNIVATLTWQTPADVDLHGYEPNGGSHVYYAARQGTTAQLDRDDTTGTGPENIFVCGNPTVGSYRFGVNYYSGSQAQTATVALRGGGLSRNFQVPLTSGIGSSGNNPSAFGQVIVTHDAQGFHYEIR